MTKCWESFSNRMDNPARFSWTRASYSRRKLLCLWISRGNLVSQKPSTMLVSSWASTPMRLARMALSRSPFQPPTSRDAGVRPGFEGWSRWSVIARRVRKQIGLLVLIGPLMLSVVARAQGSGSSVQQTQLPIQASEELLAHSQRLGQKLIAMAEDFPEDRYSFRPQKDNIPSDNTSSM